MDERTLADLLGECAAATRVPGAAVAIMRGAEVVTAYHGIEDVSTGAVVTADTRFAVGSLGKTMVATVVAQLAQAGRLSFDDPVAAHVPELRHSGWARSATIRDLLANRSRLPLSDESEFAAWPDEDDGVLSRVAARFADAEPGPAYWSYTNAGWCLLGRVIEGVSGLVWEDAMRRHLLEPSGLRQTTYTTWPDPAPRSCGHEVRSDGPELVLPWSPRNIGPAGSTVLSTVTDLLRFAESHLVDPALEPLRQPHADVQIPGWLDAWCLGWGRFDWSGGPVWGWDGLTAGQRATLRIVPEQHAALALVANSGTGRALYRSILPELMRTCFGIGVPAQVLEPRADAAGDLSRFAGVYAWPDRRITVTDTGTGLILDDGTKTIHAGPIDDRTFLVDATDPDAPTMTFGGFDDAGRPGVLYDLLWGLPRVDP